MDISGVIGGAVLTDGELAERSISITNGVLDPYTSRPSLAGSVDASGWIVAPGFVDLQINGGFGFDLLTNPGDMWKLGGLVPRHGVTSFLPTFISSPSHRTEAAISAFGQRRPDYVGAQPLGLHFEGPMLNPSRSGAHDKANLVGADLSVISHWTLEAGVVLVTLAPELPNAIEITRRLCRRGIVVSAGHSAATADQAIAGFDAGISMVTHLFNAMAPFSHREPNIVGAVLASPGVVAGLIVDGIHVDPVAVTAAWQAKGPEGIALVTDAVGAMGLSDGEHEFGSMQVVSDSTGVRTSNGTLAGSNLSMDTAVRNLRKFTGCDIPSALSCASTTPSKVLGLPTAAGLVEGAPADIVILNRSLEVQMTIGGGSLLYAAPSAQARLPGG